MMYIIWFIMFILLIFMILMFNKDTNTDDYIIEETNELDKYLKESILKLRTNDCFYHLSDVISYATNLNFTNNYNDENLTKEECNEIHKKIYTRYKFLLNDKMRRNSNIQNYLLKYFMDDTIL